MADYISKINLVAALHILRPFKTLSLRYLCSVYGNSWLDHDEIYHNFTKHHTVCNARVVQEIILENF